MMFEKYIRILCTIKCHKFNTQYLHVHQVIIGGAQEEMSLQKMIEEVNEEVMAEAQSHADQLDTDAIASRVHCKLQSKSEYISADLSPYQSNDVSWCTL